jgi:hypothetical protein
LAFIANVPTGGLIALGSVNVSAVSLKVNQFLTIYLSIYSQWELPTMPLE